MTTAKLNGTWIEGVEFSGYTLDIDVTGHDDWVVRCDGEVVACEDELSEVKAALEPQWTEILRAAERQMPEAFLAACEAA